MLKSSLKNIKILDLTNRLPGPLATSILKSYGASVTRVEWDEIPDPFSTKESLENNPLFHTWFENLKQDKEVLSLSKEDKREFYKACSNFDVIISSLSSRSNEELYENLSSKNKVVLNLVASKNSKRSSHDLNALAEIGLLSFLALNEDKATLPPFIPLAGVQFANSIALEVINALYLFEKTNKLVIDSISLEEATESLKMLAPENAHQCFSLHNGKFPCYKIYPLATKHDYVALAAMEEHYWYNFLNAFELDEMDRFDTTGKVEEVLTEMFQALGKSEVLMKTRQGHYCLSVLSKPI